MDEMIRSSDEFGQESRTYEVMPLIPLRNLTVFPSMVLHFDVGREKSILALERAMMLNQSILLTAQKDADTDLPTVDDFYHVGTVARIKQMLKLPGDTIRVLVDGQHRARMITLVQDTPYFLCDVEEITEDLSAEKTPDVIALMRTAVNLFAEYLNRHPRLSSEVISGVEAVEDAGRLADIIASNMELKVEESQQVLEAVDPAARIRIVLEYLTREIEILRLEDKISTKVKTQMSKSQREYYLREQLRAIQEELGQDESVDSEIENWKKRLGELKLSEQVTQKVEKEIGRLSKMAPNMPEASVIRSYVEWILDLPWNESSKSDIDIKAAHTILEEDHYGLDKVKDRILEYLAVLSLVKVQKGPILCLVGPPGVGKTSIARSIARAMDRKFAHMSLGGVRDEAEIRGHRRTPSRTRNSWIITWRSLST